MSSTEHIVGISNLDDVSPQQQLDLLAKVGFTLESALCAIEQKDRQTLGQIISALSSLEKSAEMPAQDQDALWTLIRYFIFLIKAS